VCGKIDRLGPEEVWKGKVAGLGKEDVARSFYSDLNQVRYDNRGINENLHPYS
jgi:hypothetical protein